ncbi:pre-tRNA nuclear export protein [Microbotryomycetes sp. JL221]|nr:pre-tRNA nuclear export protein [Microbotryomycetes sp. JL221]
MDQLGPQISSAVRVAVSPTSDLTTRQQAYTFLQQVKDASLETWQPCLTLIVDRSGQYQAEERMFAMQVVGDSLANLPVEALAFVQTSLFDFVSVEYVQGTAEDGIAFVKNAFVRLLTLLFIQTYPQTTPQFFKHFLGLLRSYPSTTTLPSSSTATNGSAAASTAPLNAQTTDLLLRLLHEVSTEVSDAQLRLNKPHARLQRDTELRDAIREHDANGIAQAIWDTISESLDGVNLAQDAADKNVKAVGLKGKTARDVCEMAVKVAGDYVSWIDINLMVTQSSIPLLLRALHLPSPADIAVRTASADTLLETVSKGMSAQDKLSLLSVFDLPSVLAQLVDVGRDSGSRSTSSDQIEQFREKLAKLLNGAGLELCRITEDASLTSIPLNASPQECKATSSTMISALLPLLLRFISDVHDPTALAVFPFATTILTMYKKEKKRAGPNGAQTITAEKRSFLTELLKATVDKMGYKDDDEWTLSVEGDEDEDAAQFAELRKNLRMVGDAIAALDPDLYSDALRAIIIPAFDAYEAGSTDQPWQKIELALALLYGYGQAISAQGPGAFVIVPESEYVRSKKEVDYHINYTQFPLSSLGDMMLRACRSKVVTHQHAAVSLQFFEIIVRYHDFFRLCPEYISGILPSFLDHHGLHRDDQDVQARVFYLFSRFIHQAKGLIQSQVSGELINEILTRMQDLLVVRVDLPSSESPSEDVLIKAASSTSFFDSQLYLFETVGSLVSILNQIPDQQVILLRAVLGPLMADLQTNIRQTAASSDDYVAILRAHHLMMAAGNVAKGFPDLSARTPTATGAWVEVFREVTEQILEVAKAMTTFLVIRDAARFAFNRIVATTGQAVLPLIPSLIDCLIGQITFPELAELLSFNGLLVAKYKTSFVEILDALLLPVVNRVVHFLKTPINGTDDAVYHAQLRRAYFNFLLSITGANLQQVLYSDRNKAHLQDLLQSIAHYVATDSTAPDQRLGLAVLNKLGSLWIEPLSPTANGTSTNGVTTPTPVPGFEQFLYTNAVKLCFELPLQRSFDFGDAQSYQTITEMCNMLKMLLAKRGDEFVEFLTGNYFASIQCPPEASNALVKALHEITDPKQFKTFFCEWAKQMRYASQG